MTLLPISYHEAQALAFAKQQIAIMRDGAFFDVGFGAFHPDAGRVLLRRIMGDVASLNGGALLQLIDFARAGWDDAHLTLTQMITEYLHRGETLPPFLATYNAEVLNRRVSGPVGPKPATQFVADLVICMLMAELITRFGLKPTRYSKRRPSAASITAQALAEAGLHRGAESAIEKVWKRWGARILDNWPATGMVSPA
jgi:hypothetical protein